MGDKTLIACLMHASCAHQSMWQGERDGEMSAAKSGLHFRQAEPRLPFNSCKQQPPFFKRTKIQIFSKVKWFIGQRLNCKVIVEVNKALLQTVKIKKNCGVQSWRKTSNCCCSKNKQKQNSRLQLSFQMPLYFKQQIFPFPIWTLIFWQMPSWLQLFCTHLHPCIRWIHHHSHCLWWCPTPLGG